MGIEATGCEEEKGKGLRQHIRGAGRQRTQQRPSGALSKPDPACGFSLSLCPHEDGAALNLHVVVLGVAERNYCSGELQFLARAALP